jgi:hypothetical protein
MPCKPVSTTGEVEIQHKMIMECVQRFVQYFTNPHKMCFISAHTSYIVTHFNAERTKQCMDHYAIQVTHWSSSLGQLK